MFSLPRFDRIATTCCRRKQLCSMMAEKYRENRMRKVRNTVIIGMVVLHAIADPGWAGSLVLSDNFDDNARGDMWTMYEESPSDCWVEETNQRLEIQATATAQDVVAGYVSRLWALDLASDFSLKIDFHYGRVTYPDAWVLIALVPDSVDPRNEYVDLAAGCDEFAPYFWYENDVDGETAWAARASNDGTLYVSYNAAIDSLYLSYTGYGSANAWQTVSGLKGRWGTDHVHVCLGGGSAGQVLSSADAYLDNFVIESGDLFYATLIGDFCGASFTDPDGYVDVWDLMQFADHWHTRAGEGNWDAVFDLAGTNFGDPDGYIDVWDLMTFADHWHEGEKST